MKLLGSIGSFLWVLLLVFLGFICMGNSFKQELWLYNAQGNGLYFNSPILNTSNYSLLLPQVTKLCVRGRWIVHRTGSIFLAGSPTSSSINCYSSNATLLISLRHFGANDTDTDALSLYEGTSYSEKEIFVTAQAHTGITSRIVNIVGTGTSGWMLFEGMNLDGKSHCYQVPRPGWYVNYDNVRDLNLTTIGSVFKGCDLQEIQNYKMSQMGCKL